MPESRKYRNTEKRGTASFPRVRYKAISGNRVVGILASRAAVNY